MTREDKTRYEKHIEIHKGTIPFEITMHSEKKGTFEFKGKSYKNNQGFKVPEEKNSHGFFVPEEPGEYNVSFKLFAENGEEQVRLIFFKVMKDKVRI